MRVTLRFADGTERALDLPFPPHRIIIPVWTGQVEMDVWGTRPAFGQKHLYLKSVHDDEGAIYEEEVLHHG